MSDIEQKIREVSGTMAMEVMPLTEADKEWLGHSDIWTTSNIYMHLNLRLHLPMQLLAFIRYPIRR